MGSGNRRLVMNTRERAVSNDIQRLQSFAAADHSAWNRRLLSDLYVFDVNAGLGSPVTSITDPLSTDIVGGLMVQPVIGSSNLIVTPGVMGCYFPDTVPSDDDDPYKVVSDPGVQTLGVLVIAANAGPGIRIDVIECQPVDTVEEQDNRDIFDPATGQFTAALVDKVVAGRLTYRVRSGAAGAGFPGTASGWVPLAIASVPSGGGASTDDVTFWDVRPLVPDRFEPPVRGGMLLTHHTRMHINGDEVVGAPEIRYKGNVEGNYGPYKAGGTLAKTTPTTVMGAGDLAYIDITNAENQEPGFTPVANNPIYIWALYPWGLHRWVRYTENDFLGQGRVPGGMRGICTVSTVGPAGYGGGNPAVAIAPPTITGLGGSTSNAFMVCASYTDTGPAINGCVADGNMVHLVGLGIGPWTPAATTNTTDDFVFVANASHPANARSILVKFSALFSGAAGTGGTMLHNVDVYDLTGASIACTPLSNASSCVIPPAGSFIESFVVEIPIPTNWPVAALANLTVKLAWNTAAGYTKGAADARIIGWRLTP
jgi:hypothetical protein